MKVLLTGAAGFIGAAVQTRLVHAGHDVVGVDAFIPQAHAHSAAAAAAAVSSTAGGDAPDIHRLDLRDERTGLAELLHGVDVVCHQAAMVGAGLDAADLPLYAGHNDLGTARLLAAMAQAAVDRLVLASSMVVYGDGCYRCQRHGDQPATQRSLADLQAGRFEVGCPVCAKPMQWRLVDEGERLSPMSSYAASKVAQEHFAAAWARQLPGRVAMLRYHNVYGPWMPADTPYAGVAAIFRTALERHTPPQVYEDGQQTRDFVHVDDVARANLLAIEAVADLPTGTARAFNVCSGQPVSILDIARTLAEASGSTVAPLVTGEFRPGDVRHIVASPARAAAELGFTAERLPDVGLPAFASAPLR